MAFRFSVLVINQVDEKQLAGQFSTDSLGLRLQDILPTDKVHYHNREKRYQAHRTSVPLVLRQLYANPKQPLQNNVLGIFREVYVELHYGID